MAAHLHAVRDCARRLPMLVFAIVACAHWLQAARAGQIQLDGRTFTLPDGFTIERVAGPPLVDRPIVGDFDEQGRLYVADASGTGDKVEKQLADKPHRIVRVEDTDGDGRFDKRTIFADHMMFPEGVMWAAGSIYISAPPSIWKLTDTNGDGIADERAEWFLGKTLTGCANDLHGPYLGPDGWIYWCKGAFAKQTYKLPGREKPFVTRAAHIFRARPDGSNIEPVMTGGMDNPVHVVFTPGGERIFTTTFLQHPAGGKRDGIIHAVYGGVYGKIHDVIDDHPRTSPDVMPVLVHLGPAACCGLVRYESESFGTEYRDNLFATCFNLHKVTRHVLTPEGATFKSTDSDFLTCDSFDFHPTEVIEDADGSLLVIDTGGWYKLCCPTSQLVKPDVLGAIYRVRRTNAPKVDDPRGLRIDWPNLVADALTKLLDDPRPCVQKRAMNVLASREANQAVIALAPVIRDSASPRQRLAAVWTATRIGGRDARAAVSNALEDRDVIVRQAAIHSVSLWHDASALPQLLRLLEFPVAHNRRVAAEALGRIGDPRAVPALLAALEEPDDRVLDHSLTYALIEIGDPKATSAGLASSNARVRRAAMIALDQMEHPSLDAQSVAKELAAPQPELRETAAWIASRHPEWGKPLSAAFAERIAAPNLTADDRTELQHQLGHLSASPAIQELLSTRLLDAQAPIEQRRIVLAAMAESTAKAAAPGPWLDALLGILGSSNDPSLLPDAITATQKLKVPKDRAAQITERLLQIATRTDLPPNVRLQALSALPAKSAAPTPDLFTLVLSQLAPGQPAAQRLSAAQVIARLRLTADQLSALSDAVKLAGPLEMDALLAAFEQSTEAPVGFKLVAALKNAKALTAVRADGLKQRLAKFPPEVMREAEPLFARLSPDSGKQKARLDELLATLPAGEPRRGQLIFNSAKAACATCHSIGYVGGNIGPDLTRVGSVRQKRDLLESIVYPSASFVQSFEPMIVDTTDGDRQSGILRKNDSQEIVLITGPTQELHIPRASVKEIRPGTLSIMPEGLDQQLSPQELADLVGFLMACK